MPCRHVDCDIGGQITRPNPDATLDGFAGIEYQAVEIKAGMTIRSCYGHSVNHFGQSTGVEKNGAAFSFACDGRVLPLESSSLESCVFCWDSENRLLTVTPTIPALGDQSFVHTYDGQQRRVTRTLREWTAGGWDALETTHFIYDGWNVIEEYHLNTHNSVLVRTLTWGQDLGGSTSLQAAGGVGGLIMVEEINGSTSTPYHFHFDGNGNVTEITDSDGDSAATYRYDAFGNTLVADGSYALTNRYRFSTKPLDSEVTNAPLYYYGYRYYHAELGRWLSRDPISEEGGLNLYGFAGNDSASKMDILGLDFGAIGWGNAAGNALAKERQNRRDRFKCCNNEDLRRKGLDILSRRYQRADKIQTDAGIERGSPIPERGGNRLWSCHNLNWGLLSSLTSDPFPMEFHDVDNSEERKEAREAFTKEQGIPKCWSCKLERRTRPAIYEGKAERRDHWVVVCSGHDEKGNQVEEAEFDLWSRAPKPGADPNENFRKNYPRFERIELGGIQHQGCSGKYTY